MTLDGDGVMYELRSRRVLKHPQSSLPDLKRRRSNDKKNSIPWWQTPDKGKPAEGWFVEYFRSSNKWIIHPSRGITLHVSLSDGKQAAATMTLDGDNGVMYELRSRNVLKQTQCSRPDLKRRRSNDKKNSIPWWQTPDKGKPAEGWFVEHFRSSNQWIIHPSRFPAKWGPYILPDGNFDEQTWRRDRFAFLQGLIPLLPPSERKTEAAIVAQAQPTECAEIALAHYKKTQGMDFALVKAVELNVIVCSGIWFHVNFEAKARDAHQADPNLLFFAELTLAGPNKMEVKCCVPVNSNDSGGISCMFCHSMGKEICHPAQGLQRWFTSTNVKKLCVYLCDVNSDGMFEFEKWYDNKYVSMQASRPPRDLVPKSRVDDKAYRKHRTNLAQKALAHYNKQTGKHFRLVEAVSSTLSSFRHIALQFPYPRFWSHANFKAKPKDTDSSDSSPKLFFAEMYKEGEVMKVTKCIILEPNDIGEPRCRYCGESALHPVDGYEGYVPPGCGIVLGGGIVLGETIIP